MNNIVPSMVKERIRLIKPSRPQAPTEYNLQYKKWPLRPFTLDTFRVVKKQPKKELIEHKDPITQPTHGLCKMGSFNSDYPCSTASSDGLPTAAVEKRQNKTNDSIVALPPSIDVGEVIDESLSSTLRTQTAKMHERQPKQKSPRKPGKSSGKYASKNREGRSGSSFQAVESFPLAPEEEFSAKLRHLTAYSNIAS
uniref:Uncharacterized protein n=3 Tax=Ciona intestinalis TaxID=7719 RepID=F6YXN3_CIOIN